MHCYRETYIDTENTLTSSVFASLHIYNTYEATKFRMGPTPTSKSSYAPGRLP